MRKSPKSSDSQDIALVELEDELSEDNKKDGEEDSIDSLTTQAPTRKIEPFKQVEEVKKNVVQEESLATSKTDQHKMEESKKKEAEVDKKVKKVSGGAIKKSVRYRVRWGDTLWDLSETFYKTPWKYKKIARYNGIKNPSKIIAGRVITIPAK